VTHLGGTVESSDSANTSRLALLSSTVAPQDYHPLLSTGYNPAFRMEIWNQPLTFYFDAGQTPVIRLSIPSTSNRFRLIGYLVDVTP